MIRNKTRIYRVTQIALRIIQHLCKMCCDCERVVLSRNGGRFVSGHCEIASTVTNVATRTASQLTHTLINTPHLDLTRQPLPFPRALSNYRAMHTRDG